MSICYHYGKLIQVHGGLTDVERVILETLLLLLRHSPSTSVAEQCAARIEQLLADEPAE